MALATTIGSKESGTEAMHVESLAIPEVKLLVPKKHGDQRGFFSEVYNKAAFAAVGIDIEFLQDNHSRSAERGTVRGLHYQAPPFAQDKLVRVISGAVFDVAVDIRRGSPTYGHHIGVELSAAAWSQLFVPIGFAHGFMTLEPNTEVIYKVSAHYAPDHDFGVLWKDQDLDVVWPMSQADAILSDRDREQPSFRDLDSPFSYGER